MKRSQAPANAATAAASLNPFIILIERRRAVALAAAVAVGTLLGWPPAQAQIWPKAW